MMVVILHSDGQLRRGRDGDTEKGCQKRAVQQKTTDDDDDETVPVVTYATSIISCCSNIQNGLTFWYQLTRMSWKLAI